MSRKEIDDYSAKGLTSSGYAVCLFPEQPPPAIEVVTPPVVIPPKYPVQDVPMQKTKQEKLSRKRPNRPKDELWKRDRWRNRLVYIVASVAFCLSLYNAYFFPLNVYRYGGQFFIPYTLFSIFLGYPIHLLEASLGQYYQSGILDIWDCAPLARCVGWAMLITCFIVSLYYNLFGAYALTYFSRCFNDLLPWTYCTDEKHKMDDCMSHMCDSTSNRSSPARHYFWANVVNAANNYPPEDGELEEVKWWLIVSLFFCWLAVFAATLRNARSVGKVAIFLVITIYFCLLMLLIVVFQEHGSRNITFTGYYKLTLFDFHVWCMAAIQVILELGLSFGIPVVYASFCHFQNLVHVDSLIICCVNYLNSILFFLLFYYAVGGLACESPSYWSDIIGNSFGMVYIVFSDFITPIPGKHLWCFMYYFMLLCIVVSTQIAVFFVIVTAIYDGFPSLAEYRFCTNFFFMVALALFGIIFCTANGLFPANLFQTLTIMIVVLPIVFLFVLGVVAIYGVSKYRINMKSMVNTKIFIATMPILVVALVLLAIFMIASFFVIRPDVVGGKSDSHYTYIGAWILLGFILIFFVAAIIWWIVRSQLNDIGIAKSSPDWTRYEEHVAGEAETHSVPFTEKWIR